jgi:2-dehydropantoate 2-reductase
VAVTFWAAGAIGSLTGAFAARAGEDVLLVDVDRQHVEVMHTQGLKVVGLREFSVPVRAVLPEQVQGPLDLVVLSVKSQHTVQALEQITPLLAPDGVVLSLQNGVNPPAVAERVGVDRTMGALIGFAGDLMEPGVVRFGSVGRSYLGCLTPATRANARLAEMQRLLGYVAPVAITDNVLGYLWAKQCDCSLLVATALTDDTQADVLANPLGRRVIYALLAEAVRAADALELRLEAFEQFDPALFRATAQPDAGYAFIDSLAERSRQGQKPHSGMWRDIVVRKRRSETEHLTGALVRRAEAAGVSVPLNARLVQQIYEIESGARARGWHNFEELAELMRQPV